MGKLLTLRTFIFSGILAAGVCLFCPPAYSQGPDSSLFGNLRWRMIGPHRGGRTVGGCGVPQQPNVFYIGVNNGGVWKTTDFGRTWDPIFDGEPTGSIGDVAVAPSDPNIVYVASGEGIQRPDLSVGDGIYRSSDGGATWTHLGLAEGQQMGGLSIDPKDPDRVFVAVLGHPYGPNPERGVYRSTDGGKHWDKVLYKDENTGAVQVTIDPVNSQVVYADLWAGRQGPWENGAWNGPNSGLYKSTDGGNTWRQLKQGLPDVSQGLSRIGFCIAPSDPTRLYATVAANSTFGGIYRSDDAGESWKKLNSDQRFWGRGDDFAEVKADPKNKDIVYTADVVVWKSTDGGMSWDAFKGAPGGDDYHRLWINPDHPGIMLIACDQGAVVTVNGGHSFSSWYNQPTAQFYHVIADNSFPYNVYGGQQESGSIGIASRGNDGEITFREWHPVGVEEYGYVAPDPLDANIIYGGKVTRYDKRTGQVQNVAPEAISSGKYRFLRTAPVLFSPIDPRTLYFAGNVLFKTRDGGHSWQVISPDLSRQTWTVPPSVGIYNTESLQHMPRRGVIYSVAPSPVDGKVIWAGTDDGLVQVTRDGGLTWKNVTPPGIADWAKVSLIDAGHGDANTAYAAVNGIRLDDMHPHIYKTHDGGASWTEIDHGLPDDPINVVREDPRRKGLLLAGSERAVYISFDDGAQWQTLRLNMPATSIRDLVFKDEDVVVGTHGRSFWILDDIACLRQMTPQTAQQDAVLYKPSPAVRVRWDMNPDTPIPPDEPAGENPPDGAVIDYYLKEAATQPVSMEVMDAAGKVIRHYSSADTMYTIPDVNIPPYWIRPQQILSGKEGPHRFVWDLHYQPLNVPASYPISAVAGNTAPTPTSPWVMPGVYTVRLVVNGKAYAQHLTVKMDPRVKTAATDLQQQHDLALQAYRGWDSALMAYQRIGAVRAAVRGAMRAAGVETGRRGGGAGQARGAGDSLASGLRELDEILGALEGAGRRGPRGMRGAGSGTVSYAQLQGQYAGLLSLLEDADLPPTTQAIAGLRATEAADKKAAAEWMDILHREIPATNRRLTAAGMEPIKTAF